MAEECLALLRVCREEACGESFQAAAVFWGDGVPVNMTWLIDD